MGRCSYIDLAPYHALDLVCAKGLSLHVLSTSLALGLALPPTLLAAVEQVIERSGVRS